MAQPQGPQAPPRNLPRHDGLTGLLSHAEDPHPRKTRRIEWLGEQSPFDNPIVEWRMLQKQYTPLQMKAIRRAAAMARTRVCRERLTEAEHQYAQAAVKGLHRTYLWNKANNFIQDVDFADVDKIMGSPVAHEFRDLDDHDADEPVIVHPPLEITVLERDMVAVGSPMSRRTVART